MYFPGVRYFSKYPIENGKVMFWWPLLVCVGYSRFHILDTNHWAVPLENSRFREGVTAQTQQ